MSDKVRIGGLDRLFVGTPVWVCVGPVAPAGREAIVKSLKAFSREDALNRIGLMPRPGTSGWEFDHDYPQRAVIEVPAGARSRDQRVGMLNAVLGTSPDVPMAVAEQGDTLILYFDHSVGDACFMVDVAAAITWASSVDTYTPAVEPNVRFPLALALLNSVRSAPLQCAVDAFSALFDAFARVLRVIVGSVLRRGTGQARVRAPEEPYQAVVATSASDHISRLNQFMKASGIAASPSAVTMLSVCRALEAEGIAVDSGVEVLVDLRRFLPRGRNTYANLAGVVTVRYGKNSTYEQFGSDVAESIRSTRPVVKLLGHIALERVRSVFTSRKPRRGWAPAPGRPDGKATITFTDVSRAGIPKLFNFSASTNRQVLIAAPPATGSHLTIAICSAAKGELQLSATYFPSQFDGEKVERALRAALIVPDERDLPAAHDAHANPDAIDTA